MLKEIMSTEITSYTFKQNSDIDDTIYHQMGAFINNNPVAWVDIEVKPRFTPPTVVEDIGSFPTGTSTDNLVLIYHEDKNYVADLDEEKLNEYARNYLISIGETKESDPIISYFSKEKDEEGKTGIYTTLKLPDGSPKYGNSSYNENENIIKVYVKGTAEIIGYKYGDPPKEGTVQEETKGEKTTQDDYGIQLSPGYCCVIGNVIYMFISTKVCLVNINAGDSGFYYRGENINTDYKTFSSFDESLKDNGYYLYKGVVCKDLEIKAPADIPINDDNGNFDGTIPTVFDSTEIKSFTTAETMTEIEYFANITNAASVTLLGIKKIGDYSFAGSNVSGSIFSEAGKLEEIGKYAFAKTSNLDYETGQLSMTTLPINLIKIDDYAFKGSMGLDGVDFSSCTKLETVGKQAFADCGNLMTVYYNASQVIWSGDENKPQILYLPPECQMEGTLYKHAPRNDNEDDVKINGPYNYDYDDEQNSYYPKPPTSDSTPPLTQYFTTHEKDNSLRTFLRDSRILWSCQG